MIEKGRDRIKLTVFRHSFFSTKIHRNCYGWLFSLFDFLSLLMNSIAYIVWGSNSPREAMIETNEKIDTPAAIVRCVFFSPFVR